MFLRRQREEMLKISNYPSNVASDTDGKQTPDVPSFFMPLQNVEYVVGTGKYWKKSK